MAGPGSMESADELYELMLALERHIGLDGLGHPRTLAIAKSLAVAFWRAGEINQAVSLLDQVLDQLNSSSGLDHPMKAELLSTLSEILFEQGHLAYASAVQRDALESRVRHSGENDPGSLEAKGDLATILFALGQAEEATRIEQEAFERARTHLDMTHPVRCVLAWNRALFHERNGDPDAARRIVAGELAWLLAEDPFRLGGVEHSIRSLVCEKLNWNRSVKC